MANISNERGGGNDEKEPPNTDGNHAPLTHTPPLATRFGPSDIGSAENINQGSRMPPVTTIIRKTSIVGCLVLLLGGLLWCMIRTVRLIHQWRCPNDANLLRWPVAEAYLLLGAEISLFVIVTLFAFMIPSLVMTWITAVVFDYIFGIRIGKERRHERRHERLIRSASNLAKEMSWSTFMSAVREGNVVGAAIVTLCLLPWVLGTSNLFRGNAFE